jgi:hypothetical protein
LKRSNNIIALITAGFLSTNLIWSAEYGYSEEDQFKILSRNKIFSDTLEKWGCEEFTLVNNTPLPCFVQVDNGCSFEIKPNGTYNFPRKGTKYFSLLLTEGLGVFHIDSKSRDAKQHIITFDPFRSAEEMEKALGSKVNQDFRALFASQKIYEILFENHTDTGCVVRLNEGCEYPIAAKNDSGPSVYHFNHKHEPHHALDLIKGKGTLGIEDLGHGKYKVILNQNPSDSTLVDALLESFTGHDIRSGALAEEILEASKPLNDSGIVATESKEDDGKDDKDKLEAVSERHDDASEDSGSQSE